MPSRPNSASPIVITTVDESFLQLEICIDAACRLLLEDVDGYLLFEQPIVDLTTLVPTTRQNPANVLIMPSRPNTAQVIDTTPAQVRGQRYVTADSQLVIQTNDEILNVNINTGSPACALPPISVRQGAPLTFKDVGGQCFAHPITFTGDSGALIDGQASYVLANDYAAVTFNPFNDGANNGWFVT